VRVISHEVNNSLAPVTSLIHSARLIAKNPEHAGKLERVFDTVEERTRHLKTFLDGYATLARLPKPRAKAVEWDAFLRQLSPLYPLVKWPEVPKKAGFFDPTQVEQVVINLIKNAAEAGSPEAEIEVRIATLDDGSTELDVLDRGPGFSPEALKNALMPLYTTKASGSGMGLSLSQEITEAHGGSIGVSNRSDGGGGWIRVILPGASSTAGTDLTRSRLTLTRA
jgi:nitrogen fixation/metabolism regulation signal transduction histidine kinase